MDKDRSLSSSENHDVSASTASLSTIKGSTTFQSAPDLDSFESIKIESNDSYLPFNREPTSSSCDIKGSDSSASRSISISFASKEEHHDFSIESSTTTSSEDRNETSDINEKSSASISFRDVSFQEGQSQPETFDPKICEARVLKIASETTIINSMIFDDHSNWI